jgi:hypothetical protein
VTQALAEVFERFSRNGGGEGPAELLTRRRDAFGRFAATGFPSSRDEEWRFTPVSAIERIPWAPAGLPVRRPTPAELDPYRVGPPEWTTLVFVNGRYDEELSRRSGPPAGVTIEPLAEALARDPALLDLADATPFSASTPRLPGMALSSASRRAPTSRIRSTCSSPPRPMPRARPFRFAR